MKRQTRQSKSLRIMLCITVFALSLIIPERCIADEISELAQALEHDPKVIFDYVHNHIDYVPYFGVLKGARGTFLEGAGNDCDQALLFVELMRASGYEARFVHGLVRIPGELMRNWLGGIPHSATYEAWRPVDEVLDYGGVPHDNVYPYDGTTEMVHVWAEVQIEGTWYVFDPAYKTYEHIAAQVKDDDFLAASGYDRSIFVNAVLAGATTTDDYVQNLNETNLRQKLAEYSTTLVNTIRNQYPNESVEDVFGGRRIVQTHLEDYETTLPFQIQQVYHVWNDIPTAFVTTLHVELNGIDHTFTTPELASGKRLTFFFAGGDLHPELWLDGVLIAQGNSTTEYNYYACTMSIDHPYPGAIIDADDYTDRYTADPNNYEALVDGTYCDESYTRYVISRDGDMRSIVTAFSPPTDDLLRQRETLLSKYLSEGLAENTEQVRGEALNIMGLMWMQGKWGAMQFFGENQEFRTFLQHTVALVSQLDSYSIDAIFARFGMIDLEQNDVWENRNAFRNVIGTLGSAFEHGALEQLIGSDNPAVSTVKMLQIANDQGYKIFHATSSNFDVIKPQLTNYDQEHIDYFQSKVDQGQLLILPEDGKLQLLDWIGFGYIKRVNPEGNGTLSMVITGNKYGGESATEGDVSGDKVEENTDESTNDDSEEGGKENKESDEPVDLVTGVYLYRHTDLALGQAAPPELAFRRFYNSTNNYDQTGLGYGWTHNYNIYIKTPSHISPGYGTRTPADAAAIITGLTIAKDLMYHLNDVVSWTTATLIHKWIADQLTENAVMVHIGPKIYEYVRLPDGTFVPPPGITAQLIENGDGMYRLEERFGPYMDFDTDGRVSTITDADGNTMNFTYTDSKLSNVQDAYGRDLNFTYTADLLTSVADSSGRSIAFTYDGNNDLVTYTDPEAKPWTYRYDDHKLTELENPLGIVTAVNTYDSQDRVRTQTVPRQGGTPATYTFSFSGYRNIEEDPYGRKTIYHIDQKGRTYKVESELNAITQTAYDNQNHKVSFTSPRNFTTAFTYDGNHNLTNVINALTQETTFVYDSEFRLTSVRDPLTHETTFDYDSEHHLTAITDAESNQTQWDYYGNGLVERMTDGRNYQTVFTYDTYGNPASAQTESHNPVTYTYDAIGQMIGLTDNEGAATGFEYDDRGKLTKKTDPLNKETILTYDDAGRLIQRTDRNNETTTYSYTPSGKLETVTYPDSSTVSFSYNLHDQSVGMMDPLGGTSYGYDELYRIMSVTDPHGFTVSYEYDEAGNVTRITYPGNKEVNYTYDELDRLKTVQTWLSETTTYTYDNAGRLIGVVNFNGTVITYAYDDADRLVFLEHTTSGSSIAQYQYTLDGNGNRLSVQATEPLEPVLETMTSAYTYNQQKNRLLQVDATSLTYDDEGQLNTQGGTSYTFDDDHRLVGIGTSHSYMYDGLDNRLRAVHDGVATRYVYDIFGNLLAEADENNQIVRYYIHGRGLLAMITPQDETYCYHFDGTGNTIAMSDSTQSLVNTYAYTPFGIIANEIETFSQPFTFSGQYGVMREPIGLYYMRARYYDPEIGRFISEDPIGFAGGDVNLYAYVGNNPINRIDPFGLLSSKDVADAAADSFMDEGDLSDFVDNLMDKVDFVADELDIPPGEGDADWDGIPDMNDPEPYTPNEMTPGRPGRPPQPIPSDETVEVNPTDPQEENKTVPPPK